MQRNLEVITKLSERVWRILGCNPGPMTLQGTNTYVIGKGKRRILLDTGEDEKPEYISNLKSLIKQENITITNVIISHWHHDHIGGVRQLLESLENKDVKIHKFRNERHDVKYSSIKFDYIQDQHEFELDDCHLKVHHTPGHSDDHIILTLKEENVLFSGDCILGEGSTVFENLWLYMKSLNLIDSLKPSLIYPGHGPVIEDPALKIKQYIDHRLQREKQILDLLPTDKHKSLSIREVVAAIYKDLPTNLLPAAFYNIKHHLEKLVKDGEIDISEDDFEDLYYKLQKV